MAINPFGKLTQRSQTLPSSNSMPLFFGNGKLLANNFTDSDVALKNSDIWSVVFRIATDVSVCDFKGPEPQIDLLNNPNNLMNSFSFWQSVVTELALEGNSYVTIERNQTLPTRLELIPSSSVTLTLQDYSKDIVYSVDYQDERGTKDFKSADMLHFKLMAHGSNGTQYIGTSPLESLAEDLGIQNYSKKLTLGTLKNAINPSTVLTVPEGILDKSAKEKVRDAFEDMSSGDNAGRAVVLDQGLTMSTIQINSDVANFLNNSDFSTTQISKAFLIPDSYLNGQGDNQSSVEMMEGLYANSLQAYIKPLESELSMKLEAKITLDESSAIDTNNQTLIDNLTKLATGTSPILTAEQAQAILNQKGVFK